MKNLIVLVSLISSGLIYAKSFEYDIARNNQMYCFLQKDGESVGRAVDQKWCHKYSY